MLTSKIDYLTLTKKFAGGYNGYKQLTFSMACELAGECAREIDIHAPILDTNTPSAFYPMAFKDRATHALIYVADDIEYQGAKIVLSGKVLQHWNDAEDVLRSAFAQGWKVTRIDIAVDQLHQQTTVQDMIDLYVSRNGDRKDRTYSVIHSKGSTLYVGSRQSARMLRVYDKAVEQGVPDMRWVRYEVEYKEYLAPRMARAYLDDKRFIYGQIVDMLNVGDSEHTDEFKAYALDSETPDITAPKADSDRVRWFKQQVLAAFEKIVEEDVHTALDCAGLIEETLIECWNAKITR